MSKLPRDENKAARKLASQIAATQYMEKVGARLVKLDTLIEETPDGIHYFTSLRFKLGYHESGSILLIAKCDGPEGSMVAFQAGESVSETILGLVNRMENGTLKWREDKPYEVPKGE